MKKKFFILGILAVMLVFGMTAAGCATNQHHLQITNVSNISEVYIRDAGTAGWGHNVARSMENIDRSLYTERVDLKVVDTNGLVYNRYNIPFGDDAFVQTERISTPNPFVFSALAISVVILYLIFGDFAPVEN